METSDKPLEGKRVLVTGGTGSFGRAFVRRLLATENPASVRVLSRDELKQHQMRTEFAGEKRLDFFIGDVRDKERLRRAFANVDLVVHAAALKQVPVCEYNPFEAIKTNTLGAMNVIDAAIDAGVSKVIAISTDKAVNPINLYGATKLCAEKLFVQGNAYASAGSTKFACARYGNVVGSRGSVIPIFLAQRKTGVLTITDMRMTRFWITLEQAAQFVLDAIAAMRGGEIFVPKLPSMRIVDLARAIAPRVEHRIIGVRPGEKIHEVLLTDMEIRHTLDAGSFYVVKPQHNFWDEGNWKDAKPLPEGFRYSSSENTWWLEEAELREMVRPFEEAMMGDGEIKESSAQSVARTVPHPLRRAA